MCERVASLSGIGEARGGGYSQVTAKSSAAAAAVHTGQPASRIVSRIASLTSMVCAQSGQVK